VLYAAFAKDRRDGVMPFRLLRAPLGDGETLLTQVRAAEVIREIRRGQAQKLIDEAHAGEYRTRTQSKPRGEG
jgi:hypothetical protein